MKKILTIMALPLAVVAALSVAGITGGCGLLESAAEGITITLPVQEFDFELNANQARDQLEQAINDQLPAGYTIDLYGQDEIPEQVCVGQVCEPVEVEETFEFELPAQDVDLSDQEDLKQYVAAGKVKAVTIESISYDITENSLNFNLPALDLYMDDLGATQISETSSKVAVMPSIAAFETGEGQVQFTEQPNGKQIMSDYMLSFKFAMLGVTTYTIDTAVTRTVPQGIMRGKVKIKLKFTVDPI